jgi:hypothetical protein
MNAIYCFIKFFVLSNVPPSFRDRGALDQGDTDGGHVGAPLNFRRIQGERGDVGVPSIGVPVSKNYKNKNNNDKIPTITIHPMQIHHCAIQCNAIILPIIKS